MKKSVRIIRLLKLLDVLEKHTAAAEVNEPCKLNGVSRRFDMDVWDCGTASCALGSAALSPWFKRQGLKITYCNVFGKQAGTVRFLNATDWQAGAKFFGITLKESEYLFQPDTYQKELKQLNPTEPYRSHFPVPLAMVRRRVLKTLHKYAA